MKRIDRNFSQLCVNLISILRLKNLRIDFQKAEDGLSRN